MAILATLSNISLRLGFRHIFQQAQFTINTGDKIGVLGLNGHGKSTLFKILTKEIAPDKTEPLFIYDKSPELSFFHIPQKFNEEKLHLNAQDFFYSFYPELEKLKIEIENLNQRLITEYENKKLLEKQQKLLEKWEFSHIDHIFLKYLNYLKKFNFQNLDLPLSHLSGGEKRKIALALGLSAKETIILWDEPTNHLDLEAIESFEDELQKSSKTFLLITHDRELLHRVCNRVVHISDKKIKSFQGSYQDYLTYLQEQELLRQKEMEKLKNTLRRETAWIRRGVQARRTKSKKRIQGYQDLQKNLQDIKNQKAKSMKLSMTQGQTKSKKLIEAQNLNIKIGDKTLLTDAQFIINNQSKIALMGANGSGKSSLVKAIIGLIKSKGVLKVKEGLKITYFDQNILLPDQNITPLEYVGEGKETLTLPSGRTKHIYSYLDDFLFSPEEARRPMTSFSGGEQKRLQLAKFLLKPSEFMIFDEPSNDLDLESIAILEEELTSFPGPIILITHDRQLIQNITNTCWHLEKEVLEIFTAGHDQWLLAQEEKKLTKQLQELEKAHHHTDKDQNQKTKPQKKLSNKEKIRLKKLPEEIEALEMTVLELEEQIESFDYSTEDYSLIEKLTQEVEKANKDLQTLYQEQEELLP